MSSLVCATPIGAFVTQDTGKAFNDLVGLVLAEALIGSGPGSDSGSQRNSRSDEHGLHLASERLSY